MTTISSLIVQWYRRGRRDYGLTAQHATQYARDRLLLWGPASPYWTAQPGDDGDGTIAVVVFEVDPDKYEDHEDHVLATMGGIDFPHSISDHGNLTFDDTHPYLVGIAADMVRNDIAYEMEQAA